MDEPDDRRWVRPVFILLFALAVLKGLRVPSRWAVTQYLFAYDHGFIRRGLWGEVLRRVLGTSTTHYFVLAVVALAVLGLLLVVVFRAASRLQGSDGTAALLVIGASPAISFVTHLAGYLEQLVYLGVFAVFALRRRPTIQTTAAVILALLAPLVHEASLFFIGPLLALALVRARDRDQAGMSARWLTVAAILFLFVASTAAVRTWGRVSAPLADVLRAERTQQFDVRPRQDAFAVLAAPTPDPQAAMWERWTSADTQIDLIWSLLMFAPGTVLLVWLASRAESRETRLLVAAAAVSPLLLHAIAWDLHRWNALSGLNAVIAAVFVLRAAPASPGALLFRPALLAAALSVAIWGASTDLLLFDAYGANHPPFASQIMFLYESATTGGWSIWIPDQ